MGEQWANYTPAPLPVPVTEARRTRACAHGTRNVCLSVTLVPCSRGCLPHAASGFATERTVSIPGADAYSCMPHGITVRCVKSCRVLCLVSLMLVASPLVTAAVLTCVKLGFITAGRGEITRADLL